MDTSEISLFDESFANESPTPSEAASSKKAKSKAARDPETNQTFDAIRKKKMIGRFEQMLNEQGFAYRVNGVNKLTKVQAGSMIHRNQKHIDAVNVSEEVLSCVFDHRLEKAHCVKRGEKLVAEQEGFIQRFEEMYEDMYGAFFDDKDQFDENGNKKTNGMERFGNTMDLLQSLESGAKSDKAVEFIHFTDYWLAKVQNSLVALHTESEEALKHFDQAPTYTFDDMSELSMRSARCRPVRFLLWPDKPKTDQLNVQPQDSQVHDFGDTDPVAEHDTFIPMECARAQSFAEGCLARKWKKKHGVLTEKEAELDADDIKQKTYEFMDTEIVVPKKIEACARCRPIEILSRRPIRVYNATQVDISNDVFRQLNYVPNSFDDQIELHLEAVALQFEPDVDEEGDEEE